MNKNELLKMIENCDDLKLAVKESTEPMLIPAIAESLGSIIIKVGALNEDGLFYKNGDIYVYLGRGGIKVEATPKGVRKRLQNIATKYGLSVIINDGVINKSDVVEVSTDGLIDNIKITKNQAEMTKGLAILCPFAVVNVFKKNKLLAKKIFIIPENEYQSILNAGRGSQYPSMMAQKSVMKRVSNSIFSLLGVQIDADDTDEIDTMAEQMRVDTEAKQEEATEEPTIPTKDETDYMKQVKAIQDKTDMLDITQVLSAKEEVLGIWQTAKNSPQNEQIKKEGMELKKIAEGLEKKAPTQVKLDEV